MIKPKIANCITCSKETYIYAKKMCKDCYWKQNAESKKAKAPKKDVLEKFKDMSSLYEAVENILSKSSKTFKWTEWLINKKNIIRWALIWWASTLWLTKIAWL